MPCDSIVLNRVDMPRMNPKLTAIAIAALGAQGSAYAFTLNGWRYSVQGGELVSQDPNVGAVADLLKRAYSAEVVKYAAKRNGWQVRQVAPFQFEVIK